MTSGKRAKAERKAAAEEGERIVHTFVARTRADGQVEMEGIPNDPIHGLSMLCNFMTVITQYYYGQATAPPKSNLISPSAAEIVAAGKMLRPLQ